MQSHTSHSNPIHKPSNSDIRVHYHINLRFHVPGLNNEVDGG